MKTWTVLRDKIQQLSDFEGDEIITMKDVIKGTVHIFATKRNNFSGTRVKTGFVNSCLVYKVAIRNTQQISTWIHFFKLFWNYRSEKRTRAGRMLFKNLTAVVRKWKEEQFYLKFTTTVGKGYCRINLTVRLRNFRSSSVPILFDFLLRCHSFAGLPDAKTGCSYKEILFYEREEN